MRCVNPKIRIVLVEDVPAEATAVEQALQRSGLAFQMQRVETRADFVRALTPQPPDVILSDHGLPSFDGFAALAVARAECPNVPFLFVTNALTQQMEIEKLAPGVADYVLKSQLHLLAPAIRHVLSGAGATAEEALRREKLEQIEQGMIALMEEYERAGGYLPICSNCKKIRDQQDEWRSPEAFFSKYAGLKFTHGICPECLGKFMQ